MPPSQVVPKQASSKTVIQKQPTPLSPASPLPTAAKHHETEVIKLDVKAAAPPITAGDAVDFAGVPIRVGMFVDLYFCKVVGLRTSTDNRLNIVVVPGLHKIVTSDPDNPLNGIPDDKGILVSGYHCIAYPALADRTAKSAAAQTTLENLTPDEPEPLPSNFLTPSFS